MLSVLSRLCWSSLLNYPSDFQLLSWNGFKAIPGLSNFLQPFRQSVLSERSIKFLPVVSKSEIFKIQSKTSREKTCTIVTATHPVWVHSAPTLFILWPYRDLVTNRSNYHKDYCFWFLAQTRIISFLALSALLLPGYWLKMITSRQSPGSGRCRQTLRLPISSVWISGKNGCIQRDALFQARHRRFLISLNGARYNRNVTMAMTTKIITSHFAISMEKPAIPRAPSMNATRARIRKTTAR